MMHEIMITDKWINERVAAPCKGRPPHTHTIDAPRAAKKKWIATVLQYMLMEQEKWQDVIASSPRRPGGPRGNCNDHRVVTGCNGVNEVGSG